MLHSTLLFCMLAGVGAWPTPRPRLGGVFVPVAHLDQCPALAHRDRGPVSASDVRPDDISVVMALGDSITAGFLARSTDRFGFSLPGSNQQQPVLGIPLAREYRGIAYPIGGDKEAITIPNILSHWSRNVTGMSTGHHPPLACMGRLCTWNYDDGLNVALSGSTSDSLLSQVRDRLLPAINEMHIPPGAWKYVNLGIGANDICAFCMSPNSSIPLVGTPREYANNIRVAIDHLRKSVPNIIVNIVGLFRVSSIYRLTLKDPYCRGPLVPPIPHLPVECTCAMLPGPAGDYTRAKMDELSEEYDTAVLAVIREWANENDPSFAVTWQPGAAIDLERWPIEALSPLDCFHPSEAAHERVAAGFWNRLVQPFETRAIPIQWEDEIRVRCIEEGDRISVWLA